MKFFILFALLLLAAIGKSQSSEAEIKGIVEKAAKAMVIPGVAWAVVKDGKILYQGAYGLANLEFNAETKVETPFLIASVTKQFTATAIMKLVEESKVDLDAKISTYLDETPDSWSQITVRNLLTHTSGLTDRWEEEDLTKWRTAYSKSTMYAAAKAKKPLGKAGEQLVYSDQGYFLLGMIIERVTGKLYSDYLAETFFKPLGMTASRTEALQVIVPGLATGYMQINGTWMHNVRRTQYGMTSHYGVISTVGDLAKWAIALMDGKVLKPESVQKMFEPSRLANGGAGWIGPWNYGFGWFLRQVDGRPIVQHAGSTGTNVTLLPDRKVAVIVLTNLEQLYGGDATSICKAIYRAMYPDMTLASLKAKEDRDKFGPKLKEALEGIAAGKLDKSLYTESLAKTIEASLPQQRAGLAALGLITKIELIDQYSVGTDKVSSYRVVYKDVTLYAIIARDASGKLVQLAMERG